VNCTWVGEGAGQVTAVQCHTAGAALLDAASKSFSPPKHAQFSRIADITRNGTRVSPEHRLFT